MVEKIILVGFMGAGKTTIGQLLADRLGWAFIDFDARIEAAHGQQIAEIFEEHGEDFFRRLEAELTLELRGRRHVVLAPGGGWMAQPQLATSLRPDSLVVWLQVRPETAYARCREQLDVSRPLLSVGDPLETIRSIMATRAPSYRQADLWVDTDGRAPDDIVEEILEALGARAGPAG